MIQPAYPPEEASGIWVVLESEGNRLADVSLELLGKAASLARQRGTPLVGLLPGYQVRDLAGTAIAAGADRVLLADHPELTRYRTLPYTRVVADAVRAGRPEILLLGATPNGRDLAGRLAVRLRTGLTADCTDLSLDPETGLLLGLVSGFGGGVTATIRCATHRPQMATVRPGVFPPAQLDPTRVGQVEDWPVVLSEPDLRVRVVDEATGQEPELARAPVLVAGGRGTNGDFRLLHELAELFGGEVGATRVAVDEGWIERERQIGQTGTVARPRLAIAVGASGAMQFTVGIESAETVVAINADPDAPIFEQADYCVVDDLFAVLGPLVRTVRSERSVPSGAARATGGNGTD